MKFKTKKFGFTLIELLVVIAVIGLLSTIALASFSNARAKARDARRVSDLTQVQKSIEMYFIDYNQYPLCSGNTVCSSTGYSGPISTLLSVYSITVPNDPINQDGAYGYYYARGYKKTGAASFVSTGLSTDYILATRLEASQAATFSGWNNSALNWLQGN